jgi:ribonuclease HI
MGKYKPGFYTVQIGRKPGIYLTWEECKAQVNKFPSAKYKKFYVREEAEKFLRGEKEVIKIDSRKLQVWTDGSTFDNGSANARAGIGVFWKDNDIRNLSERLPGEQTNNRAEIYAVIRALETCDNKEIPIEIMTDSKYVINAIELWIKRWEKNGWLTSQKTPVKHSVLIKKLKKLIESRTGIVKLIHVRGHQGNYGNEKADKLSKQGSLKEVVLVEKECKSKISDYFQNK